MAEGAAGYFEQFASDDMRHQLAGVLLLETQAGNGDLSRALAKIPDDIPVLHIAAKPNFFDTWGDASEALEAARPGQFNGVQLIGGRHSDAFRTSNPFIQFVVSLATGFSTPQNVDAVQVLAQGWIDDMYADTVYDADQRTGLYGEPSTIIDIPTERRHRPRLRSAHTQAAQPNPAHPAGRASVRVQTQLRDLRPTAGGSCRARRVGLAAGIGHCVVFGERSEGAAPRRRV